MVTNHEWEAGRLLWRIRFSRNKQLVKNMYKITRKYRLLGGYNFPRIYNEYEMKKKTRKNCEFFDGNNFPGI